ncbi:deoxynucleotidyltransferase terminal-interacting protein 2-like isoform X1 [Octopus sinensis]|uniref:Deoxynucleotidyltransferase terminal-interacting protein 2-like isoform X1 n=1 Tax=Octopus sinensis TaxID=2607531 RepID=A0A7E6FLA5_9MOLL|nr:deoxynucleotidyltransferase terminal-interacting protein 2-like isoform X1 [Octopus sinensis]
MEDVDLIAGNISSPKHEENVIDLTQESKDVSNQYTEIIQDSNSQTNCSMSLFVLDRAGDKKILKKFKHKKKDALNELHEPETKTETLAETPVEKASVETPVLNQKPKTRETKKERKNKKLSIGLVSSIDPHLNFSSYLDSSKDYVTANKLVDVNQILKSTAPPPDPAKELISKRKQKLLKKKQRSKVAGDNWFNMGKPEMTRTIKNELALIQMRNSLDPKRFYKSNDRKRFPKYFQMGTVVESAADFYHARIPKKQRKANIVEEMMANAETKQYVKKKYADLAKTKKVRNRNKNKKKK